MYIKTIFVIVALIAATSAILGSTVSAYQATIHTDEIVTVVANNGTSYQKPLTTYDFKVGPQGIPYSVTMVGQ